MTTAQTMLEDVKKYTAWLPELARHLPEIGLVVLVAIVFIFTAKLLLCLWEWHKALRQKYVFIEVTPPATSSKTPPATQKLYEVLHGIGIRRSFKDRLLYGKMTLAYELPSEKRPGIRYIIKAPAREASAVQRGLIPYLPTAKIHIVDDFMPEQFSQPWVQVVEFAQLHPFPFPLNDQESFAEHDLSAYITNAMTGLDDSELMIFQVVATPITIRNDEAVVDQLIRNENLLLRLSKRKHASGLQRATSAFFSLLSGVVGFITDIIYSSPVTSVPSSASDQRNQRDIALRNKPARSISSLEQKLHDAMHNKAKQPKFKVEIRTLVAVNDKDSMKQRIDALNGAINSLSTERQALKLKNNYFYKLRGMLRLYKFTRRLPSLLPHNSAILAASELASIYHFPTSAMSSNGLVASYNRTLGATLSLRQPEKFDVIIGENVHNGETTKIGMTTYGRERHMFVVGSTGSGKTTMIENAMVQDIRAGRGVGFIDPHGDAAKKVLQFIPEERIKDVVYFHPDDVDFPFGLNLTEIDPAATGSDRVRLEIKMLNLVVEALRKSFSEDATGGHRIEAMLRNGLQTALTIDGATIFTINELIRDASFRKAVVKKLKDKRLINFWSDYERAGEMQQVSMTKGLTLKLDRFEGDPAVARVLGQKKSTINFADIIDNKKILICDLSKGEIGSDNSSLFGTLILTFLQIAAEQRARMEQAERSPFYLYVDEFQNFATKSFTEMASQARKYGLFLTIAEQTTSQIEDKRLLGELLGNIGTIVTFRTGNPADEKMLLPFFGQFLDPGEINSLPAWNFYARLSSQESQPPVSGKTIVLEGNGSKDMADRVIAASRKTYGREYIAETHEEPPRDDENEKGEDDAFPTQENR